MVASKKHLIILAAAAILCLLCGFFVAKGIYDQPIHESVTRDTVTRIDTVFRYHPQPVEEERVRTEYRWLTRVTTDTVTDYTVLHDSVLVEVPIESKHYNAPEYDAWVSGYQPSLDSIRVYQKENYITETITNTINPKRKPWGIGFHIGYGYDFRSKTAAPFVGVGLSYDIISF